MLVWTDALGPADEGDTPSLLPPLMNDLDLTVEVGLPCTGRYVGNDMNSGLSVLNGCGSGTLDTKNNVEMVVFNPAAPDADFTVRVTSRSGSSQDFALVVYNAYASGSGAPLGVPSNLVATASTQTSVQLSWNAASAATAYDVQRSAGVNDPFVSLAPPVTLPGFADDTAQPNKTYLYRVRARNSTPVASFSNVDAATTVVFDDPLLAQITPIRAQHIVQLRVAAAAMRTAAGQAAYPWTDSTIVPNTTFIRAVHLTEIRAVVAQARQALSLAPAVFPESLTQGVTPVRALHVQELRDQIK